jgi:hypothetical protein
VWQVAFNRFHDQLVLTGGSDGRVKLENTYSVSSAATLEARADAGPDAGPDRCVLVSGRIPHTHTHG